MIGQALSLVAATWLLVMRVVALYGGNKKVAIALYAVFISTHLVTIILSAVLLAKVWCELASSWWWRWLIDDGTVDLMYFQPLAICVSTASRVLGVVYMTPVRRENL